MSLKTLFALAVLLLLAAGSVTFYVAGQEPGPLVNVHGPASLGRESAQFDVSVDAMGTKLTRLNATLEQGALRFPVFALDAPGDARFLQETPHRVRITRPVSAKGFAGLKDGPAKLVIDAERTVLFGLRRLGTAASKDITIRTTLPTLAVVSTFHYVKLGGAEMIVYRATPADVTSGVLVGDRYYPGYPASGVGGAKNVDPALRVAFFALMFDQDMGVPMSLVARDAAGNTTTIPFDHKVLADKFHRSRVPIDDRLLSRVVPAILKDTPGLKLPAGTPEERLAAFLTINRDVRKANADQIETLSKDTSPTLLWRGLFGRMARAASAAVFADHRTYMYAGKEIDQQVHLGVDLASVRGAAVSAANAGRVVFAGPLGIYGNCVIIDHGMGLQTLYAHLSAVEVEKGDSVSGGEVVGRSGETGLAGGDHLHFTTLVAGRPVNPVGWWDPHWIADRIDRKLLAAGIVTTPLGTAVANDTAAPAKPARTKAAPKKKAGAPARARRRR